MMGPMEKICMGDSSCTEKDTIGTNYASQSFIEETFFKMTNVLPGRSVGLLSQL